MVWTDPVSQDPYALQRLSQHYGVPILAIHAPCLIITQRVWTTDPWTSCRRRSSPPSCWARRPSSSTRRSGGSATTPADFARGHRPDGRRDRRAVRRREHVPAAGARPRGVGLPADWDVAFDDEPYRDYTLDLSHTAVSQSDALAMLDAMGDGSRHLHIADGTGLAKDEHLIPGRGTQPCAEVLETLAARGFDGHVIVEVNTRRALDRAEREADLAEALAFCRLHSGRAARAVPAAVQRDDSAGALT